MSEQGLDLSKYWTEAEFLALGETDSRIELINGKLRVSPSPKKPHQGICYYLMTFLEPAARRAGLRAFEASDVRLGTDCIVVPDISVGKLGWDGEITEAGEVALVVEVTSPSNARNDRVRKMHLYAAARIPWYLLVEPNMADYHSVMLQLYRLDGTHYVEHAFANYGQTLVTDGPFPLRISTTDLIRP
ncbi:Uma2 family endonuclease [Actinoplanes tereljensis]|nr:Uma2 family endonuclease [Actinoplanes tereljensis]